MDPRLRVKETAIRHIMYQHFSRFQLYLAHSILGERDQNVCSNEGCDYEITKLHDLKIFVPRTRKPSSPEVLGTFQPNLAGSTLRCLF